MESFMLKTEVQNNGEILLYYVDENGENQEGVLTTIDSIENNSVHIQDSYMLDNYDELVDDPPELQEPAEVTNLWSDDDTIRLLTFYNDNKTSFVSGTTKKKHLWAVACKTMLIGKNQQSCEEKLDELKIQYSEVRTRYVDKGIYVKWPFLDLCHTAFYDEVSIAESILPDSLQKIEVQPQPKITVISQKKITNDMEGILSVKQISTKSPDEQTKLLLNTYMKYKEKFQKEHWRRDLWDKIAQEVGEVDSEYLQKKFLNHKQHYISLYLKRKQYGPSSVLWPYMELFDKIYRDDAQFLKKHFNETLKTETYSVPEHKWNISQIMILVKYYFDCYEEFQDATIPQKFLWTEVGRLVDKKPETCQTRYEMLRREHLEKHIAGDYNLQKRLPLAILFDNIILKDVIMALSKMDLCDFENVSWKEEKNDEMVQYLFSNMEVFKDQECHFVCWAAVAHKLKESIKTCKYQWDELVVLYKQILEEKKEDPDLQIDWRYIDLFDRIFDYGMDEALLIGYDVGQFKQEQNSNHILVKKVNINPEDLESNLSKVDHTTPAPQRETRNNVIDINEPRTDPRSTKILEYHLKNKDKFQSARNKLTVWDPLANQIGMNATECAHRFKTLKHTYIEFIKKEIDTPRIPITWPYYALCKRVFGYRIIKNQLKQGDLESDSGDWLESEIKRLIHFFSKHFHKISNNIEDVSKWTPLASDIGKSETNCKEKFVELRKCYRKLKTMRTRNPDVKISWSYFNVFDRIYSMKDEPMEVESLEEEHLEPEVGDDDYQCIIVLQDGQVILNNSEVNSDLLKQLQMSDVPQIAENNASSAQKISKWTKQSKKRLLISYINYVRSHRGKEINSKDMWSQISSKIRSKTSKECRKMLVKMMNCYKRSDETVKSHSPFSSLLEKVFKLKPKFTKEMSKEKIYKDVHMASEKVTLALQYYLEHIDDFVNPKFERKYLWTQLANYIGEPLSKVYNKINYLKQAYDIETEEINEKRTEFSDLLKEVIAKEVAVKIVLDVNPSPEFSDAENSWTDDEVEQLLIWYLGNLDKFKNPKFNRSYLWMDASCILSKSPLVCSKKMTEIRSQYRNMVKENVGLEEWRFFELCQKIYGTGKRNQSLLDDLIFAT